MQETVDSVDKQGKKLPKSRLFLVKNILFWIALVLSLVGLYFLSRYNYLLFHSTIEVFTTVIAIVIFTIAWNSRKTMDNNYLAFVGIAFLFIGGLDLLHTLAYSGMGVFPQVGSNLATQLWIAMRYMFAFSMLIPVLFIRRKTKSIVVLFGYSIVTALVILSIFYWNIFPQAFVDNVGLTAFKIGSEYVISVILAFSMVLLYRNRAQFSESVFKWLMLGLALAIATEMTFTLYTDVHGITNTMGHLLNFFSFYLVYKALVETGFSKPYDLMFRNLKQSELSLAKQASELTQSNQNLEKEIVRRRQTEQELTSSKRLLENVFDGMVEGVFILDKKGQVIDFNDAFTRINKFKDRQDVLKSIASLGTIFRAYHLDGSFVPVEEWPATKALRGESGTDETYLIERTDLGVRWITSNSYCPLRNESGEIIGAIQTLHDITERKKAEETLAFTSSLAENLSEAVISTDLDYKIKTWNKAAEAIYGFKEAEVIGRATIDVLKTVILDGSVKKAAIGLMENGSWRGEAVQIRKDGSPVNVLSSVSLIRDKEGKPVAIVAVNRDITRRKRNEEALAKQAVLIDLSPDGIIVRKTDGTITFWSKGAEALYGWTKDEAVGQQTNKLLKTKFSEPFESIIEKMKVSGRWSGELVHTTKGRREVVVQSWWMGRLDAKGEMVEILESSVDVTDRKQMQIKLEEYSQNLEKLVEERTKQLKDAERLAAIGATAGMVGHDIRNPLQAITGDVYLTKTELAAIPEGEEKKNIQESLSEIEKNVDYINKIVADLQDFARPLNPHFEETDLKLIIDNLLSKNGLPENIKVSVKLETGKVVADSTFLNRIMYNLVNNAVQAMPKGGKLIIHTYKEENDTIINVKDTGVGIPEAVKGKLFTPMFTTKSKGQGFGLAVIKRMTEALGGNVSFKSQEGKGTTFTVRLPPKELNGK